MPHKPSFLRHLPWVANSVRGIEFDNRWVTMNVVHRAGGSEPDDRDERDRDDNEAPETPPDEPRPPQVEEPPPEPGDKGPYVVARA